MTRWWWWWRRSNVIYYSNGTCPILMEIILCEWHHRHHHHQYQYPFFRTHLFSPSSLLSKIPVQRIERKRERDHDDTTLSIHSVTIRTSINEWMNGCPVLVALFPTLFVWWCALDSIRFDSFDNHWKLTSCQRRIVCQGDSFPVTGLFCPLVGVATTNK